MTARNRRTLYGLVTAWWSPGVPQRTENTFRKDVADRWAKEFGPEWVIVHEDERSLGKYHERTNDAVHPRDAIKEFDAGIGWDIRLGELIDRVRNPHIKRPRVKR